MASTSISTKFGNASIYDDGYYQITSRKEGNHGKKLHRLIFEDFYNITLPDDIQIHHNDGDKLNNNIWNLVPMKKGEHQGYHNHLEGCKESSKLKISESMSTSGFFRVSKQLDKRVKQGFYWVYQYYEGDTRKKIHGKTIDELKNKVLERGLIWKELN